MRYPKKVNDFIAKNVEGLTTKELAELVNIKFSTDFTESKMKSYKANHKLKSGTPGGWTSGKASKAFPEEVKTFIYDKYKGVGPTEMTDILNNTFQKDYKVSQLKSYYANHDLNSGISGHFNKGHVPQNKGVKGYHSPGSEKGWFKKGSVPHNNLAVGTELFKDDGYMWVKISEPNVWRQKHILIWEAANGPIPKGHLLTFLDVDKSNIVLDNLALITMAESLALTRSNLRSVNAEFTKTGILIARLKVARYDKIKSLKKTKV